MDLDDVCVPVRRDGDPVAGHPLAVDAVPFAVRRAPRRIHELEPPGGPEQHRPAVAVDLEVPQHRVERPDVRHERSTDTRSDDLHPGNGAGPDERRSTVAGDRFF